MARYSRLLSLVFTWLLPAARDAVAQRGQYAGARKAFPVLNRFTGWYLVAERVSVSLLRRKAHAFRYACGELAAA